MAWTTRFEVPTRLLRPRSTYHCVAMPSTGDHYDHCPGFFLSGALWSLPASDLEMIASAY